MKWIMYAWRALWIVPAYTALVLYCLVVCMGWGPSKAIDVFHDAR